MRRLIWVVLAVSGLWSGFWFAGSTVLENAVRDGLAQAAPGVTAARADVAGFPNRFDLTLTDLRVGEAGQAIWKAPFLQTLSLSYKPWHQVLVFPPTQTVTLPDGTVLEVAADKLQASLRVTPSTEAALELFIIEGHNLSLRDAGPMGVMEVLNFSARPVPGEGSTYDFGLNIQGLRPDSALFTAVPDRPLPTGGAKVHADVIVAFSAPLDRHMGETHPVPVMVDIRAAQVDWGDVAFSASGQLRPDAGGFAQGQIDLTLSGWDSVLAVAVAAGAIPPGVAKTWSAMARGMAEGGGNPEQVQLALILKGGQMRLGPLPLGPAPRFSP